mmetsp:Transcript_31942/g.71915  ORF Transcript_31942/g.71915 Transcript_31942/m.71915 type:complete len:247 (-) Transcript_31942:1399-2139(-)
MELIDDAVHDLRDLIHEGHDLALEHLGRSAEVPDPGGADYALDARAIDHGINSGTIGAVHVVLNDVRTRLSEAKRQQGAKLDDRLLEDHRLHELPRLLSAVTLARQRVDHPLKLALPLLALPLLVHLLDFELLISDLHRHKRALPEDFYLGDHVLNRVEHKRVRVVREEQGRCAEGHAHKERDHEREPCFRSTIGPKVEVEADVPFLVLRVGDAEPGGILLPLPNAEVFGACYWRVRLPLNLELNQ